MVERLTCFPRARESVEEQEVEGDLQFPPHDLPLDVKAAKCVVLALTSAVFSVAFLHTFLKCKMLKTSMMSTSY